MASHLHVQNLPLGIAEKAGNPSTPHFNLLAGVAGYRLSLYFNVLAESDNAYTSLTSCPHFVNYCIKSMGQSDDLVSKGVRRSLRGPSFFHLTHVLDASGCGCVRIGLGYVFER